MQLLCLLLFRKKLKWRCKITIPPRSGDLLVTSAIEIHERRSVRTGPTWLEPKYSRSEYKSCNPGEVQSKPYWGGIAFSGGSQADAVDTRRQLICRHVSFSNKPDLDYVSLGQTDAVDTRRPLDTVDSAQNSKQNLDSIFKLQTYTSQDGFKNRCIENKDYDIIAVPPPPDPIILGNTKQDIFDASVPQHSPQETSKVSLHNKFIPIFKLLPKNHL